ncbi:AraC family transcriptional regulator [Sorangium cellulosum]|uniref:AraC family transcriptional regulator n=1 Tax=Sorangium cellulosum TaxID=56 RepID=A0A2L0EI55_SORCE|nr:AraC family transcriptional regulator [Sorangium cellulosum]AUX38966.1 AraC family transcriptional regulator [Sorangium cellulosum]
MVDRSSGSEDDAVDPLSGVLDAVRLRGSVFGAGELGAPWGVQTPGIPEIVCYVVVRGAAHLALLDASRAQVAIASGDVVLVEAGRAHALRDSPSSVAVSFDELRRAAGDELRRAAGDGPGPLRWGGPGPRTTLVCGSLAVDEAGRALLGSALSGFLHLPAETAGPGLLGVLSALASEVAAPRPGSRAALTRLAELVFIHALRASIARGAAGAGWLKGLGHPSIARALAAIHADPGAPWTVDTLAGRAGMSRSAFAAEFRRHVGEPPLAHVTAWRMRHAARLLEDGRLSLKDIAAKVGYGSDEAFNRVFKGWAGVPPGEYRRRAPVPR